VKTTAAPPSEDAAARPNGSRLTVNYLLLTGGECLAKLATFIAFAYLARVLGLERYGSLEFVLATMMFFTCRSTSVLASTERVNYRRTRSERPTCCAKSRRCGSSWPVSVSPW
jgi:hypothetical protein